MKLNRRRRQMLKQKFMGIIIVAISMFVGLKYGEIGTVAMLFAFGGFSLIMARKTIYEMKKLGIAEEVKEIKRENKDL